MNWKLIAAVAAGLVTAGLVYVWTQNVKNEQTAYAFMRLLPDQKRYYINDTGCGNTVNLSHPRVLQLVMDSLRYWVAAYHVDGFRFDLGVTLGREGNGYDVGSGFFDAIRQDPVLSRVKLYSEPWDVGPGGYQLGNMPPGKMNSRMKSLEPR